MVNVEVKRQSDFLQEVLIHNHAEYGEHGQDLGALQKKCEKEA